MLVFKYLSGPEKAKELICMLKLEIFLICLKIMILCTG